MVVINESLDLKVIFFEPFSEVLLWLWVDSSANFDIEIGGLEDRANGELFRDSLFIFKEKLSLDFEESDDVLNREDIPSPGLVAVRSLGFKRLVEPIGAIVLDVIFAVEEFFWRTNVWVVCELPI